MVVHFIESAAPNAQALLGALREALARHPACLRAQLLVSSQQPGLFLLMSEWRGEPQVTVPAGAKAWTFRTVAPYA
jgi:quinol monooxygenase YgiN